MKIKNAEKLGKVAFYSALTALSVAAKKYGPTIIKGAGEILCRFKNEVQKHTSPDKGRAGTPR